MSENNILGVILAGGKSKRFGNDKTIAKLGNKTLLDHTIEKIEKNFNEILIVSNSEKIDIKKKNIFTAIGLIVFILLLFVFTLYNVGVFERAI